MDHETQRLLAARGLADFEAGLAKLGVARMDDLEALRPDDLQQLGMSVVQMRKFEQAAQEARDRTQALAFADMPDDIMAHRAQSANFDSASAASQEPEKRAGIRHTIASFPFLRKRRGAGTDDSASFGSSEKHSAGRRGGPRSDADGGGYGGGGIVDGREVPLQSALRLEVRIVRLATWDYGHTLQGATNGLALIKMYNGGDAFAKWSNLPSSNVGATPVNLEKGSTYQFAEVETLNAAGQAVKVPAVKAVAQIRASVRQVMSVLLMDTTDRMDERMGLLDGTYVNGQVLRLASPRSSDGKRPEYEFPSLPLCTIKRSCHRLPDSKIVRDFVYRDFYELRKHDGKEVGVRSMVSVEMGECPPRGDLSRGTLFEGTGLLVWPINDCAVELCFVLVASTDSKAGRKIFGKSTRAKSQQLEAMVSMVDSTRVWIEGQLRRWGDLANSDEMPPPAVPASGAQTPDPTQISGKAVAVLLSDNERQQQSRPTTPEGEARSARSSSVASGGPSELALHDAPPVPPRTDLTEPEAPRSLEPIVTSTENDDAPPVPPRTDLAEPEAPRSLEPIVTSIEDDDGAPSEPSESGPPTPPSPASYEEAMRELEAIRLAHQEKERLLRETTEELEKRKRISFARKQRGQLEEQLKVQLASVGEDAVLGDDERSAARVAELAASAEEAMATSEAAVKAKDRDEAVAAGEEGGEDGEDGADVSADMERNEEQEIERLRRLLDRIRIFLPPDVNEEDLDVTLEQAEARMKEALHELLTVEDMAKQQEAQVRFDKWDNVVRNHPEYKERERQKELKWEEDNAPKNKAALDEMRGVIKEEYFSLTPAQLEAKGLTKALIKRLRSKKVFQLYYKTPEEINKLHHVALTGTFSAHGLDLVEHRALYACLPDTFTNDSEGKKTEWKDNIKSRLQELTKKEENGQLRGEEKRSRAYNKDADVPKARVAPRTGLGPRGMPRGPPPGLADALQRKIGPPPGLAEALQKKSKDQGGVPGGRPRGPPPGLAEALQKKLGGGGPPPGLAEALEKRKKAQSGESGGGDDKPVSRPRGPPPGLAEALQKKKLRDGGGGPPPGLAEALQQKKLRDGSGGPPPHGSLAEASKQNAGAKPAMPSSASSPAPGLPAAEVPAEAPRPSPEAVCEERVPPAVAPAGLAEALDKREKRSSALDADVLSTLEKTFGSSASSDSTAAAPTAAAPTTASAMGTTRSDQPQAMEAPALAPAQEGKEDEGKVAAGAKEAVPAPPSDPEPVVASAKGPVPGSLEQLLEQQFGKASKDERSGEAASSSKPSSDSKDDWKSSLLSDLDKTFSSS